MTALAAALANLGDLDGDEVIDLATGAVGDDDGGDRRGAVWILFLEERAPLCEIRTDYDAGGCSGTFQAFSLSDLNDYVTSNFGKNGGSDFQHLKIMADLTDPTLDIESPCAISLADNVTLSGDFVSLDGRKGVLDNNGYTITAQTACVLSEQDAAGFGSGSVVNAEHLTIQGAKTTKIGLNSTVTVVDTLLMTATGDFSSSDAIIKAGTVVEAGSVALSASRGAHLGENTTVTADMIALQSTGDTASSDAGVKAGAQVTAETVTISASREATVGQNVTVSLSGDLTVLSTGNATGSLAIVKSGANVTVGGAMDLSSGNKATIGQNSTIGVAGNLNMDAAALNVCTVNSSAVVTFGSKSGVCAPLLP